MNMREVEPRTTYALPTFSCIAEFTISHAAWTEQVVLRHAFVEEITEALDDFETIESLADESDVETRAMVKLASFCELGDIAYFIPEFSREAGIPLQEIFETDDISSFEANHQPTIDLLASFDTADYCWALTTTALQVVDTVNPRVETSWLWDGIPPAQRPSLAELLRNLAITVAAGARKNGGSLADSTEALYGKLTHRTRENHAVKAFKERQHDMNFDSARDRLVPTAKSMRLVINFMRSNPDLYRS